MDIRGLQLHFKKEDPSLLYVIQGDDYFLKSEAESIIKNHFKEEGKEFDLETFYGDQMSYEKCLDSIKTLSFFSSFKIIHIKNADKLKSDFLESLVDILEMEELSDLVIVLTFTSLDKRKKTVKKLVKQSILIEVKSPYDNQIEGWIQYIANKENVKIGKDAISLIKFLVGPSLVEVSKNIKNLKEIYPNEEITKIKMQEVISKNNEEDIFKICDHLGNGKVTEALISLEEVLKSSSSGIGALNLFYRHFKILEGIILETSGSGSKTSYYLSKKDLAAKVGVPTFFLDSYQKQTKIWSLKKLKEVFFVLEAADLSLKSTKLKERTVFSALFIEISKTLAGSKKQGQFVAAVLN